ncbi:hypothetical protein [Paenibacillus sp. NAIST15-1]|uniref:hypothetical protein n=1 Tax=Paenibacillus sp. NAIST15-1 TaxID=1605994 RepID=UPI000AFA1DBA|nr:hypothetical protein [Paenibacillus sp. NAIST15-1]
MMKNNKTGRQQLTSSFLQLTLLFIQHSVVHIYSAPIVMYADAARMKQRRLGFG